ncbi:streptomycin-6-phosphate phosphatase [Trichosporon asahii var. asahii CBS 2479]|uniref:alkaline phosphatase n=1 Tax=Trichosporon asahii var. asahii (strain ATCC 90039 / CBS 2479 / JCM 2466 / KCTC 7840 / NBRC 103889/ NCYC 2677 / UAMH 7654) TaxID=1186058 RepID=J6F4D5_TRIAS|nr:streptomycin-6-phosphate phosphatase [Trichosporon asahii var. asahii CBS 2479]EJT51869.1 streptomycin-6-phosphate phosphatase [Trichosporon asahii var. asahii CBS 2479]
MSALLLAGLLIGGVNAQTFRRTAACPTLGCVFPPDQADFISGQTFDIRIEVQAPVNGSEAYNGGSQDSNFELKIGGKGAELIPVTQFFNLPEPELKNYTFHYYEDLFAEEEGRPTLVNVFSKTYRNVQLHNPGQYELSLSYHNGEETKATWGVNERKPVQGCKPKNLLVFIGDGMATSMISAARLLAHKTINGKYQTTLKLDEATAYGSQMTHSLDSFITDSANSASSLFTGKKMTVNGLNAYTDSTGDGTGLENAKVETVWEMFRRLTGGQVGIVSKAYIADATPAAVCTHTSQRGLYDTIIEQYLVGLIPNTSDYRAWYPWQGVDVLFGGGGENFLPGKKNGNVSQFERWEKAGYQLGYTKTDLEGLNNDDRALAIFTQGNISTWLDQHVFTDTLKLAKLANGTEGAYDQPGLKDMTLKAIDILSTRAKKRNTGWALMSEAALIDKQMHVQDVDRALGDLLELDDTVRATLEHLESIGELEDTLVVVTADHGHGFDVFGSTDTKYLQSKKTAREKRNAVGTYLNSGLSNYVVPHDVSATNHTIFTGPQGPGFPVTWDPRYTIAHGWAAFPDKREDFQVKKAHERLPAVKDKEKGDGYFFNPLDAPDGFEMTGNMNVGEAQGVHSLVDVPVYAWGPGHEIFRGVMSNVDIAFRIAQAMDLGRDRNETKPYQP